MKKGEQTKNEIIVWKKLIKELKEWQNKRKWKTKWKRPVNKRAWKQNKTEGNKERRMKEKRKNAKNNER